MKVGKTFYAPTRIDWRAWLKKHSGKKPEIWLVFYKKSSGVSTCSYAEAVEEALCFGWIDTTVKTIDGKRYAQRFCPRRSGSVLSELNKYRVRKMIRARKMTGGRPEKY